MNRRRPQKKNKKKKKQSQASLRCKIKSREEKARRKYKFLTATAAAEVFLLFSRVRNIFVVNKREETTAPSLSKLFCVRFILIVACSNMLTFYSLKSLVQMFHQDIFSLICLAFTHYIVTVTGNFKLNVIIYACLCKF